MRDYKQVLEEICRDERYQRNLDWGKPRKGHPEGTIRAHIEQLEQNLEAMKDQLSGDEYWKLKILIHVHDIFKPDAKKGVGIQDPESHASLAAAFLSEYCDDEQLITIAHLHDEPYALWRKLKYRGRFRKERFDALCERISDWDLFLTFLMIDGNVAGKSQDPLIWFFTEVCPSAETRFKVEDVAGDVLAR